MVKTPTRLHCGIAVKPKLILNNSVVYSEITGVTFKLAVATIGSSKLQTLAPVSPL